MNECLDERVYVADSRDVIGNKWPQPLLDFDLLRLIPEREGKKVGVSGGVCKLPK